MTSIEIQELLEGAITDERMAELLHRLSVSPEKRAELRQHLELRSAVSEDKAVSRLSSEEDAALWGAIAGAAMPAGAAAGSKGLGGFLMKGASILAAGVVGYLLGTNLSFFGSGSDADVEAAYHNSIVAAVTATFGVSSTLPAPEASVPVSSAAPLPAASGDLAGNIGRYTDGSRPITSRQTALTTHANTERAEGPAQRSTTPSSVFDGSGTDTRNRATETAKAHTAERITSGSDALGAARERLNTRTGTEENTSTATDTLTEQMPRNEASNLAPTIPSADQRIPQDLPGNVSAAQRSKLIADGPVISFSDRVGLITPVPSWLDQSDADPEFSSRTLDFGYRFNQFTGGLRLGYGTFSMATLQYDTLQVLEDLPRFKERLEAVKQFTVELFLSYRYLLTDRLSLDAEVSGGGSDTYQFAGGNLFLSYLLTDNVGLQVGGGLGGYRYNLDAQAEELQQQYPNAMYDQHRYEGTMVQGRYGLFYQF